MLVLPCTGWQATKRIYRHLLHLGQALADGACMTSCHSQCEHHDNSKVTILRGAGTKNLGLSYPARQALADGAMEHVWQAVTVNVNTMTTVTVTILRGTGTKNLGLSDPASLTTKITGQQDSCRGPRSWCCDSTSGFWNQSSDSSCPGFHWVAPFFFWEKFPTVQHCLRLKHSLWSSRRPFPKINLCFLFCRGLSCQDLPPGLTSPLLTLACQSGCLQSTVIALLS